MKLFLLWTLSALSFVAFIALAQLNKFNIFASLSTKQKLLVREILANQLKKNHSFLLFDLSNLSRKFSKLGDLKGIVLEKKWPNQLYIKIKFMQPVALFHDSITGQVSLFDLSGFTYRPLKKIDNSIDSLVTLEGKTGDQNLLLSYYQYTALAFKSIGLTIQKLEFDNLGNLRVRLGNDGEIVLGSPVGFVPRVERFSHAYQELLRTKNRKQPRYIDLRYENGFAVRWNK